MEKIYTPLGKRTLVTSRGVSTELEGGLVMPKEFLRDSDVCTTDDGRTVIIKSHSGKLVSDRTYIVDNKNILAEILNGCIIPQGKRILARKCEDDKTDGILRIGSRYSQFVEVLAVGDSAEGRVGDFGYVSESALNIQRVEEGLDEWLIDEVDVMFYAEEEE